MMFNIKWQPKYDTRKSKMQLREYFHTNLMERFKHADRNKQRYDKEI